MFKWRSLRGGWIIRMMNSEWCRKLVPNMRWSMSEGSMSDFEWWWWFDKSDIWWRARVVTMRRLNGYKVIAIWWLSGIDNFVREMILYSSRSETLSQWKDFKIGVMCWNFGAWTKQFEQENNGCVGDDLFDILEDRSTDSCRVTESYSSQAVQQYIHIACIYRPAVSLDPGVPHVTQRPCLF